MIICGDDSRDVKDSSALAVPSYVSEYVEMSRAVIGNALHVSVQMTSVLAEVMKLKFPAEQKFTFQVHPSVHIEPLASERISGVSGYELLCKCVDDGDDAIGYSINDRCGALITEFAPVTVEEAFEQFEKLVRFVGCNPGLAEDELQRRISRYLRSVREELGLEEAVEKDFRVFVDMYDDD
jgi:hypothetical protein